MLGLYISEEWEKAQRILEQLKRSGSEDSQNRIRLLERKWEDINGVMKCRLGASLL